MNAKSIVLEHLPQDRQLEAKIIIDTFGRFYRIPKSIFSDGLEQYTEIIARGVDKADEDRFGQGTLSIS